MTIQTATYRVIKFPTPRPITFSANWRCANGEYLAPVRRNVRIAGVEKV